MNVLKLSENIVWKQSDAPVWLIIHDEDYLMKTVSFSVEKSHYFKIYKLEMLH